MDDIAAHSPPQTQSATSQCSAQQPSTSATPAKKQPQAVDDPFYDFFTISTNSTCQQAPPTTLVASPSSPGTRKAGSTISPPADDPQAGFGSPAAVGTEEQRQQPKADKQPSVQQHLLHQYSHLHGRLDQLPFEHLQEMYQQGGCQQHHTTLQTGQMSGLQQSQQQPASSHWKLQQQAFGDIENTLLPACARLKTLNQLLQQHGATQGDANANIRLLLATISAKQVKTRQLVASLHLPATKTSSMQQQHQDHLQHDHEQLQQQFKQVTEQLASARSELDAARSELAEARAAEARQAELLQLQEQELSEVKDTVVHSESGYRSEISNLQERLLEAEGQLAQLSSDLPGGRRKSDEVLGSAAAVWGASTSRAADGPQRNGGVQSATPELTGLEATVDGAASNASAGGFDSPARPSVPCGLVPSPSLSLLTPDQAAAAQLKGWLRESQAALMEAQEDLMEREKEIKQLKQQLQQLTQQQQQQQEEEDLQEGTAAGKPGFSDPLQKDEWQHVTTEQQQQRIEVLESTVDEVRATAADACLERDALCGELHALQAELSQLKEQSSLLTAARDEALVVLQQTQQSLQELQQDKQQAYAAYNQAGQAVAVKHDASTETEEAREAERLREAEHELQNARETAAAALGEVAKLQQQLENVQQQQVAAAEAAADANTSLSQDVAGQTAAVAAAADNQQPEKGSLSYQLLLTTSQNQALHAELADTKQRLLLLLQLVKKAAAAVTAAGRPGEAMQLPAEWEELTSDADAATRGAAEHEVDHADIADLLQLTCALEQRYCGSAEQQQLLLRGREMQFLLENALHQVHLIKAAGSNSSCGCPSEQEYQQLAAKDTAANADAAQTASSSNTAVLDGVEGPAELSAAASGPTMQQSGIHPAAAAAAAADDDDLLVGLEQFGSAGGPTATSSAFPTAAAPQAFSQNWSTIKQAGIPSSCSSGARVGYSGGAATGGQIGFTVVDEGLGYDGFDGSWWAKSSIGNTTTDDLPPFLIPKSG